MNHGNHKGDTALLRACWKGGISTISLLLAYNANPNQVRERDGVTPLIKKKTFFIFFLRCDHETFLNIGFSKVDGGNWGSSQKNQYKIKQNILI